MTKYFGAIPKPTRVLENNYTEEPAQDGERRVTLRRVGDVAIASAVYHICAGAHPDYVSLDTLEHILTSSPSGRLYKALVETRAQPASAAEPTPCTIPGCSSSRPRWLRGTTERDPGHDERDRRVNHRERSHRRRSQPRQDLLAEVVGDDLNDSQQVAIQLSDWAAQGDWRLMFLYRDRLEQVTPASVNEVAKKYLRRNNRTVGLFLPSKESERVAVPATRIWRR